MPYFIAAASGELGLEGVHRPRCEPSLKVRLLCGSNLIT